MGFEQIHSLVRLYGYIHGSFLKDLADFCTMRKVHGKTVKLCKGISKEFTTYSTKAFYNLEGFSMELGQLLYEFPKCKWISLGMPPGFYDDSH